MSYRMTHDVRARTCSKNFAFRWFLVLFGLLVMNGYYLFNEVVIHYGHVTLKTLFSFFTLQERILLVVEEILSYFLSRLSVTFLLSLGDTYFM